jgi:PST family polysaccharide transporter
MSEIFSELSTMELKKKAVKSAGVNVAGQFIGFLCHTLGVIVLARLLTPRDFGLVAMVTAFSLWVMNFGINGFTEYIIQKQYLYREEVNSIFWLHVGLACLLAVVFSFFGLFLVDFYSESTLSGISVAMTSSFIFRALSTTHMALLMREMRFSAVAATELIAVILSVVFAIAAALGGLGYWAVVTRQLSIPAITMVAAWILCSWRPGRPSHLSAAIPGLRYAIQVYFNFSLGYIMRNIDKVLLGKFYGSDVLGNYDRAYHLSSMPASQLLTPLHGIALATLTRLRDDKERFLSYFTKAVSTVALLGSLLAAVLMLTARDLIPFLLGPDWVQAGPVVMAFSPGIAPMFVYGTHSWLHLALGMPDRWLRWNIFATIITIAAVLVAMPFGAIGMALACSTVFFILFLPALWYAGIPVHLGAGKILSSIWPFFVSALFVCGFWLFLSEFWAPLNEILRSSAPLSKILITTFVTLFVYVLAVIVCQRNMRSFLEILSLAKLMLSRRST